MSKHMYMCKENRRLSLKFMKKKHGTLSFSTTWMELEPLCLAKQARHRKTNAVYSHLGIDAPNGDLMQVE